MPTAQQAAAPSTPSGETPPRSRAGRPLGPNSASLESYAHPLVRDSSSLKARVGPPPPARDATLAPSTRALNALARRERCWRLIVVSKFV
jgi:hypothetical protein